MNITNNAHEDKADAKKQQIKAQIDELTGKLKEATADAKIALQDQLDKLRAQIE